MKLAWFIVWREYETHGYFHMILIRISSYPQGVPEKKVLPITVPESPAFALKKRVHVEPKVEEVRTHLVVLN